MALVNRYGLKRTQIPIASFFSFMENGKSTASPPLNCNINPGVRWEQLAGPASLRIVRRTGNADVRANFLNHPHHRAWEKFLEGAERVEVKFYSWS